MPLIDDQGRLFGKINVIDGAVLSLIAVFVVASGAFLLDGDQTANVHAQIEAQDVPKEASNALAPGTELHGGAITVTDVQRVEATSTTDRIFARLNVTATLDEDSGRYRLGQAEIAPGSTFPLSVAGHTLEASIALVDGQEAFTYLQPPTDVLFVSREVERPGEEAPSDGLVSLGANNVLDVNGSAVVPRSANAADVFVWGSTYRLGGDTDPGTASLLPGASASLSAPGIRLDGELRNAGQAGPPVEAIDTSVTVLAEEQEGQLPRAVVGDELRLSADVGATVADVVRLDGVVANVADERLLASPADGPKRLLVELDVSATAVNDRIEFRGEELSAGEPFSFAAGSSSFEGTIREVGAAEDGEGSITAHLRADSVPPWAADRLDVGDVETSGSGEELLTIEAIDEQPSTMIVTSDDGQVHEREHPRLVDLHLEVELATGEQGTWKDAELAPGEALYVRPDGVPLAATVLEVT